MKKAHVFGWIMTGLPSPFMSAAAIDRGYIPTEVWILIWPGKSGSHSSGTPFWSQSRLVWLEMSSASGTPFRLQSSP